MKVAICVDITEEGLNTLDGVAKIFKQLSFNNPQIKLHMLHVFETKVYAPDFYAVLFPTPDQYPQIDESAKMLMKGKVDKLADRSSFPQDIHYAVIHSVNPKEAALDYLKENNIDLAVIPTRGLTGMKNLLSSSFANFMNHHAPCSVLVVRPH